MHLTPALIKELREEFLLLMKNAAKVRTMKPETFKVWDAALRRWWKLRLEPVIDGAETLAFELGGARALERAAKPLRHLALPGDLNGPVTQLRKVIPPWAADLVRGASALWSALEKLSKKTTDELPAPREEEVRMEGFVVVMKHSGSRDLYETETLPRFKELLRQYRQAAAARLPLLLRGQLPLHVSFGCEHGDWDHAASYGGDHISACVGSLVDGSDGIMILTHEMGHHIWRTFLSAQDQRLWKMVISGEYGEVDLRDVIKLMSPGDLFPPPHLAKTHPVLYLQLEGLREDRRRGNRAGGIANYQDLVDYLRTENPIIQVKAKPITGYGAQDEEEGFCEALGLLVGYGPKALLPEVRQLLKVIIPGLKTAGRTREHGYQEEMGHR